MAIVQAELHVPDDIYLEYVKGDVILRGLAKDADNGRIVKHIDLAKSSEGSNKALKTLAIGALVTAAIEGLILGGVWLHGKIQKKRAKNFERDLNNYIAAVNEQHLTEEDIDKLIKSFDALKKKGRDNLKVSFSTGELAALVDCLCNYTHDLAAANKVDLHVVYSNEEQADNLLRFRKDLTYQKQIFQKTA